jgi:hypothetical protein
MGTIAIVEGSVRETPFSAFWRDHRPRHNIRNGSLADLATLIGDVHRLL